ncbi:hypothetical protein [Sphingomonas oryzagri]
MPFLPLLMLATVASADNDGKSRDACLRASGMDGAAASAPVHFSDRSALDVLLVTGHYPPRVNKGRAGTMLCLYDRRTKLAQVRDADAWSRVPKP